MTSSPEKKQKKIQNKVSFSKLDEADQNPPDFLKSPNQALHGPFVTSFFSSRFFVFSGFWTKYQKLKKPYCHFKELENEVENEHKMIDNMTIYITLSMDNK